METQVHDNLNPNLYSIPSRHCRLFSFPHSPGFCSLRRDMTVSLPLFVRVLSPPMTAPVMTTTTTLLPFFLPYFETSFFFASSYIFEFPADIHTCSREPLFLPVSSHPVPSLPLYLLLSHIQQQFPPVPVLLLCLVSSWSRVLANQPTNF